jgi:hypothetical protein
MAIEMLTYADLGSRLNACTLSAYLRAHDRAAVNGLT